MIATPPRAQSHPSRDSQRNADVRWPSFISPLVWLLTVAALLSAGAVGAELPNGVAAGDVTSDKVFLWARTTVLGDVIFDLSKDSEFGIIERTETVTVTDTTVPAKAEIFLLDANARYYYRAIDAEGAFSIGTFVTPTAPGAQPPGGPASSVRFGVSGDWRGELAPFPAISNAPGRNLDFFVALGDTIYADFPSPDLPIAQAETLEEFRIKQNEVYSQRLGINSLGDLRASTSWLATIDDHEVTNDFAGGAPPESDPRFADFENDFINETPLYQNGLQAFVEYNPISPDEYSGLLEPRFAGKPRLYKQRTWGNSAALFLLDARSFRDAQLPTILDPTNTTAVTQFLVDSFNPERSLLGSPQIIQLEGDLLEAQQTGVRWKFIVVPEPIQNLGPVAASDRFEGYAAERTRLLRFIDRNFITNVVFVAADLHGTTVNDITYQLAPDGPHIATGAFEVITGAVAFDQPFGPTAVGLAQAAGLLSDANVEFYQSLTREGQDEFFRGLVDAQLAPFGYEALGLEGSSVDAELLAGSYVAAHTYGWTEFEMPTANELTVTTYGIEPYNEVELAADPDGVLARTPEVVSQFSVDAIVPCEADATTLCLGNGRFEITVNWRLGDRGGAARANTLGANGGYVSFFNPIVPDLYFKMVDGRLINGSHWIFTGALTNAEYTASVTDRLLGITRTFGSPAGRVQSRTLFRPFPQAYNPAAGQQNLQSPGSTDAAASMAPTVPSLAALYPQLLEQEGISADFASAPLQSSSATKNDTCQTLGTVLCIGGRFRVEIEAQTPRILRARQDSNVAGHFWLVTPDRPEVGIKVLDGRAINGHFWLFIGDLTDAGWTITLTDTETEESYVYTKADGILDSRADIQAF